MRKKSDKGRPGANWRRAFAGGLSAAMLMSSMPAVQVLADPADPEDPGVVSDGAAQVPQNSEEAKAIADAAKERLDEAEENLSAARDTLSAANAARTKAEQDLSEADGKIRSAKSAVENLKIEASKKAEAAKEVYTSAQGKQQNAESDKEAAQTALSEATDAELEAKALSEAAAAELTEAEGAYQTSSDAYDAAETQAEEKQAAYEEAAADHQAAETQYAAAKSAYETAQADAANKQDDYNKAVAASKAAQDALTQADTDLKAAKEDTQAAGAKKEAAQKAYAENGEGKTSSDFFTSIGDTAAAEILTTAEKRENTKIGDDKDATSLENMASAIKWMYRLNDIRKAAGLSELPVSSMMMAFAQSNANYSDQVIGHARQFGDYYVGENLAWNHKNDPSVDYSQDGAFNQWYTEEKAIFDQAVDGLKMDEDGSTYSGSFTNKNGVSKSLTVSSTEYDKLKSVRSKNQISNDDLYDLSTSSSSNMNAFTNATGHYLNIIDTGYVAQGFAICTRGTKYPFTYSNTFALDATIIGKTWLFRHHCG